MSNILSKLTHNLNNAKENHKYIYNDTATKFIYSSLNGKNIVGINKLLFNKVVEVSEKKYIKNKMYGLIKLGEDEIGWLHLENLTRIYRLPQIYGKLAENLQSEFNGIDYKNDLDLLKDKIIKAFYYFSSNNKKYLLIGKISGNDIYPIEMNLFVQLHTPNEDMRVKIPKDTALYHSSNYQSKIGKTEIDDQYLVLSYFNGSNQVKVKTGKGNYWVILNYNMSSYNEFTTNDQEMDIIDFITFLYNNNIKQQNKINNLQSILNELKENILINNEDESLYLKRYLGEKNDS